MATHAFFKALLFLAAGSVIHALQGEQDIRRMGALRKNIPITFLTFFIGVLAISGIPPFAGFFSKDEILAKAFEHNIATWVLAVVASLLTAFYMFRLLFLVFYGDIRASAQKMEHIHESPYVMTIPLIALAALSTISGFIGIPEIFHAPHLLEGFLSPVFAESSKIAHTEPLSHTTEYTIIGIMVLITVVVIAIAYLRFVKEKNVPAAENEELKPLHRLVYRKYFVDEVYHRLISKPLYSLANLLEKIIERLGIDKVVNSFGIAVISGSKTLRLFQTGGIGFYIMFMVLGIITFLILSLFV